MAVSLTFCRRLSLISAALLALVALVVAFTVIPSVRAEVLRGSTPQRAVHAFWANVLISGLAAAGLWLVSVRARRRSVLTSSVLGLLALASFLLGLALTDAALAYRSHGPEMQVSVAVLFICSAIDFLAALLVVITALFFPRHT